MSEGNLIEITVRMGDETVGFTFPSGTAVGVLADSGHLRALDDAVTRVNGVPADESTVLSDGDCVSQTKAHGEQG